MHNMKPRIIVILAIISTLAACASNPGGGLKRVEVEGETRIRAMTFNILHGGTELGQPLERTAEAIWLAEADIVILQERKHSLENLAPLLGWNAHPINDSVAILCRYPITNHFEHGVETTLPDGTALHVFGVHLEAYPYGPYDLRDDPSLTPDALIDIARDTRHAQIRPVLAEIRRSLDSDNLVILGGDFNEPSHLDWTVRMASAGRNFGRAVAWPTSQLVYEAGLADSYRQIFPDETNMPAYTWTPLDGEDEVHDRIDLMYHGPGVIPVSAAVVGEPGPYTDLALEPYPSDHRAVVVEYALDVRNQSVASRQ